MILLIQNWYRTFVNIYKVIIDLWWDMFNLFKKDPIKKLEKDYAKLLEDALAAQRKGDIDLYSQLSFEAEEIGKKIDELKAQSS